MGNRVIYATEHFTVQLPAKPHIPREDGGHIYITSKEHFTDRTEMPAELLHEMADLSAACARSYRRALSDHGVEVARINFQENGNWAFRKGGTQEWGQALSFPDPDTGFYDGFAPLTEADIESFLKYMKEEEGEE